MKCFECGSKKIGYDPTSETKFCRDCGVMIEEFRFE